MNQHQQGTRRRTMIGAAIIASGCLALGPAAPAVASTAGSAPRSATAAIDPAALGALARNLAASGVRAIRPATRSLSTKTPAELAENAGAARSIVSRAESAFGSRAARSSANASRLATETSTETRFQRWLAEDGPEILHETECALIWDQMYPDEQEAVGSPSGSGVSSASVEAIANAATRRAARAVGRPVAVTVGWMQWAQGVQENAEDALGGAEGVVGLQRPVELEDGVVSLALVGYARYCLQPPAR